MPGSRKGAVVGFRPADILVQPELGNEERSRKPHKHPECGDRDGVECVSNVSGGAQQTFLGEQLSDGERQRLENQGRLAECWPIKSPISLNDLPEELEKPLQFGIRDVLGR